MSLRSHASPPLLALIVSLFFLYACNTETPPNETELKFFNPSPFGSSVDSIVVKVKYGGKEVLLFEGKRTKSGFEGPWSTVVTDYNDEALDLSIQTYRNDRQSIDEIFHTYQNVGGQLTRDNATQSSQDSLTFLSISSGTLSPVFASGSFSYIDSVENIVETIFVTPGIPGGKTKTAVNDIKVLSGTRSAGTTLTVGSNIIKVTDTASNGHVYVYAINVIRAPNGNTALSALTTSVGILVPAFDPSVTTYSIAADYSFKSIKLKGTAANPNSVVKYWPSDSLKLLEGTNVITMSVVAQDKTEKPYTITLNLRNKIPAITSINPDTAVYLRAKVALRAVANDSDGSLVNYTWDFNGDGILDYSGTNPNGASYLYPAAAIYNAALTAYDDGGKSVSTIVKVDVEAIRYPATIERYGMVNILDPGITTIPYNVFVSFGAILPAGAKLKVVLYGGRWLYESAGEMTFDWGEYDNATNSRVFTSNRTGPVQIQVKGLTAFKIDAFEDGSDTPTISREILITP